MTLVPSSNAGLTVHSAVASITEETSPSKINFLATLVLSESTILLVIIAVGIFGRTACTRIFSTTLLTLFILSIIFKVITDVVLPLLPVVSDL